MLCRHLVSHGLKLILPLALTLAGCNRSAGVQEEQPAADKDLFPREFVQFEPHEKEPIIFRYRKRYLGRKDPRNLACRLHTDLNVWKNVQDEPVITMGPGAYDKYGVALNQVIRYGDYYYAYYHGTPTEDWSDWNTDVAVSKDLNTWTKYPGNPIVRENKSSGILVHDGEQYRHYTLHDQVQLHFPGK